MRTFRKVFIVITFYLISNLILAQDVVEVKKKELSPVYRDIVKKLEELKTSPNKAIELLNTTLPKLTEPFERFNIISMELPSRLSEIGKHRESFEILKKGQVEGLFYPIMMGQNKFPPYITNFETFDDFNSFLDENIRLRNEAQKNAQFEYIVNLPKNYSSNKKYPLMIILYGGFGSHIQQMQDWCSPKLESDYVTAYMQGDQCVGSFLKRYQRDSVNQFVAAYNQIISKYSIDTTSVVIGAQSAGTYHTILLMVKEAIPVKGALLAFPIAVEMDSVKVRKIADRGIKISLLIGEKDPRFPKVKEMIANFEKYGLKNRFTSFSEKGHEFPENFPIEIDKSLEYINE